jgi:hypothetical protein
VSETAVARGCSTACVVVVAQPAASSRATTARQGRPVRMGRR